MDTHHHNLPQRGFVSHVFLVVALGLTVLCILGAIAVPVAEWLHMGFLGAVGLVVGGFVLLVLLLRRGRIIHWVRERRRRQRP